MKSSSLFILRIAWAFLVCSYTTTPIFSQTWSAGIVAGVSNYQGDLIKEDFSFRALHPAIGGVVRSDIGYGISANTQLFFGTISGSDTYYPERGNRNLSFCTNIVELSISVEYNILPLFYAHQRTSPWKLRAIGGAGALHFAVPTYNLDKNTKYQSFEATKPILPSLHFGISTGYQIGKYTFVSLDITHRSTLKDNLDGLQRKTGVNHADWYYLSNISVTTQLRR